MRDSYDSKKGMFNAKTGMDIAFAAIFIIAIGLTVADSTVTNLTTAPAYANGTPTGDPAAIVGTSATVLGYSTLVIGAGFLYGIARLTGIL